MKKVLVIAVHPDDETLGCGGTILRHKAQGDAVYWLILSSMTADKDYGSDEIHKRAEAILHVSHLYGFDDYKQLSFPTTLLDTVPKNQLIDEISSVMQQFQPHTVYLPFKYDVHSDHRIAFEASYSCTKSFRYPFIKRILMMETLSETEFAPAISGEIFSPNIFVDITLYFEKKIEIAKYYEEEFKSHPFPRSYEGMKALATLRGGTSGCQYAESFMLLKEINP